MRLRVRVSEHKKFKRDGLHIHVDVPVKLTDALLGCVVDVETLDGLVSVRVPPGVRHGDKQVIGLFSPAVAYKKHLKPLLFTRLARRCYGAEVFNSCSLISEVTSICISRCFCLGT